MAIPLVSVCMITYNHAPFIARAIEDVLQQKTNFPFELVIGEDCSTDGTRDIVLQYEKQYPDVIRVIALAKNIGLVKNLCQTEKACRGQYVAYCEGDDYWHNAQKLQQQVDFLERHSDYAMIHSNAHLFVVKTGELKPSEQKRCQALKPEELNPSDGYLEILSSKRWIWTLTVCTRKSLLDAILQHCPECRNESYLMGDIQRWLELSRMGKIMYFEEPLATRNQLVESASQSEDPRKMSKFGLAGNSLVEHYLNKYPCPEPLAAQIRREMTAENLRFAWQISDREMAQAQYHRLQDMNARISLTNRLLYWGTRNQLFHFLTVLLSSCKSVFRRSQR
jgi:hypothetical protein